MERIGPPFARRGFAPKQRCCVLALCSAALFTCFETHGGETSAWLPAFVSATTSRMNCSRIGILPLQRGCRDNVIERHAQHRSGAGGVPGARPARGAIFTQLFASDSRPVVLYDGVCNMCNKAVDVAIEKDPSGEKLRFAALQSKVGKSLLVHCGHRLGSEAPLYVGEQLQGSAILQSASSLASKLIPKGIRDTAYNTLAANRYRVLGRRDDMRLSDDKAADRFISDSR